MQKAHLFLLFAILGLMPFGIKAQEQGEVQEPREVRAVIVEMEGETVFEAQTEQGEIFRVDTALSYPQGLSFTLAPDDRVLLRIVEMPDGTQQVFFDDKIRTQPLLILFLLFALSVIVVGFFRGVFSLIGLAVTVAILFAFLFPSLIAGRDPILFTVLASILILFVNIHISHGFHRRTFFAFLGTTGGLALTWLLTSVFSRASSLSGLGAEEANVLIWKLDAITDSVGIFIAAAILGTVGVLDDVAVAQSEIVEELSVANPQLTRRDLFASAMRVGQHHIASTVNTLVLVYASAALPMFLLYFSHSSDVSSFLNNQAVAEEIVRILTGTIALILTVPLATALATIPRIDKRAKNRKDNAIH
ncbi:YibE/F family protein [Candidatus Parcubacteria bacterium]|nr:YibE/F family protein [Candidatus Parcubacteria bacterium]